MIVTNNGYGISTRTQGKTFYNLPEGPASEFYGIAVHRIDGRVCAGIGPAHDPVRILHASRVIGRQEGTENGG